MTRFHRLLTAILLALVLSACFGSGPAELLDTAQLEEQQMNPDHALELYNEIVSKHPESEQAVIARERIKALGEAVQE